MRVASVACLAIGIGLMGLAAVNIAMNSPFSSGSDSAYSPKLAALEATPTSSLVASDSTSASESVGSSELAKTGVRRIVYKKNPKRGETLGILSLPTLGQMMPIIEGTRDSDLKKGVGHFTKSVMPGQKDNCVVSAHRDTYFSRLGDLEKGDKVVVQTARGSFTYKVDRIRIVGKNDRTVIVPTAHGVLTLSTCYPFNYVGAAPKRYVVSARMVKGE